jgi:hypothetical protein
MARQRARMTMFGVHQSLADFRRREIESFIQHSRQGMKATWKEFGEKFDKTTAEWSEEDTAEYVDHIYDDIAMLRDESPQLLRHAQCMIVYGTFENSIVNLCRAIHRDGKITTPLKDKAYMDDVKGYLKPHIGATAFGKEWEWMHEFRIIRNWMAHNGGKVQEDTTPGGNWERAQTFVRRNRGLIKFARYGEIIVEDGLVDRALEKAEAGVVKIEKAVKPLYR